MNWNENPNRHTLGDIEDLAHPPSGGRLKFIALGILLPAAIAGYAARAWVLEEAIWLGQNGSSMDLTGDAARSLAVCYAAAAMFCHFRWFWGLVPSYRIFSTGIVISMLTGLGACSATLYHVLK
ncbi:MAG: hypothetical protein WBG04_18820 [Haloferula sp.]